MLPLACALCFAIPLQEPKEPKPIKLPSFDVKNWVKNASPFDFKKAKGKVIMMIFTPTFCCGHDVYAGFVRKALDTYGQKGLQAVGIFANEFEKDHQEAWRDFIKQVKVTWSYAIDPEGKITSLFYPADSIRFTIGFVDCKGWFHGHFVQNEVTALKLAKKYVDLR
jgi:hypothetical protein